MSQGNSLKALSFLILCTENGEMSKQFTQMFEGKVKTLYRAHSAAEWLKTYARYKPDILFGEYALLHEKEYAGVKKLRQYSGSVPIVFYFLEQDEADIAEIAAFGNCFLLFHPIKFNLLKEVLSTASRNILHERTLKAKAIKTSRVFEALPQLVCIANKQGEVLDANHRFLEYFGFKKLEEFKQKYPKMHRVFAPKNECIKPDESENWIEAVLDRPMGRRKVCFIDSDGNAAIFQAMVDFYGTENPNYVFSFSDMTAEENLFKEMLSEYEEDVRPKVYSWKIVREQVNREVHRAKRYDTSFCLILLCMVEKDGSRKLLDKREDKVFAVLEKLVHKTIRPTDYMGQWENNRYVILTPHTDAMGTKVLISRLQKECDNNFMIKQLKYRLKFGVAQYQDKDTATQMLKRAQNMLEVAYKKPDMTVMTDLMIS